MGAPTADTDAASAHFCTRPSAESGAVTLAHTDAASAELGVVFPHMDAASVMAFYLERVPARIWRAWAFAITHSMDFFS